MSLSETKCSHTGILQGCVVSPILFTLYTIDSREVHPNNYIIKFDTVILGLLHTDMDMDLSV